MHCVVIGIKEHVGALYFVDSFVSIYILDAYRPNSSSAKDET